MIIFKTSILINIMFDINFDMILPHICILEIFKTNLEFTKGHYYPVLSLNFNLKKHFTRC